MLISITRLRLRSIRFLPGFALYAGRSFRQVQKSKGFLKGSVLRDRSWTFWTMTAWDSKENMLQYMTAGAHKAAMPKLLDWCDEASVTHWEQAADELPSWSEADQRMRSQGRLSKVRNPSPRQAAMDYEPPLLDRGTPIFPDRT